MTSRQVGIVLATSLLPPAAERRLSQRRIVRRDSARNRSSIPLYSAGSRRQLVSQDIQLKREYLVNRFDKNADQYDENMEEDEQPSIFRLLELADIQKGESVLDLATGTGLVADYVVDSVGPAGTVLGLDASEGMLRKALAKLDASPEVKNLAFIHSSVEEADFQQNSLDVILCHNGMFYFQDLPFVVRQGREWLRKSGGRFVYNVQEAPSHPAMPLFQKVLATNGLAIQEPGLAVGTEENIRSLFGSCGYNSVTFDKESTRVEYSSLHEYVEDAWDMCCDMTDFDLAEEELQQTWFQLRDIFLRAAKNPKYQTHIQGVDGPILETTHMWVKCMT